jgi:hypothetical protein
MWLKSDKIWQTLHEDLSTFYCCSLPLKCYQAVRIAEGIHILLSCGVVLGYTDIARLIEGTEVRARQILYYCKGKVKYSNPITGLWGPEGSGEVKASRFRDIGT